MNPANGLCPCSWAKSTVLRSMVANMAPRKRYTGASVTSPGAGSRIRRGAALGGGGTARAGRGSVERCVASSSVPMTQAVMATATPDAG
jgi:hypothetical protein